MGPEAETHIGGEAPRHASPLTRHAFRKSPDIGTMGKRESGVVFCGARKGNMLVG